MEAAADALPEVVGVLPSLDGDGNGEPEAVLLSPDGLRMTLDQGSVQQSLISICISICILVLQFALAVEHSKKCIISREKY